MLRSQEKERRDAEEKLKSQEKKQPVAMKTSSFYSSSKPLMRTPDAQQMESVDKAKEVKTKGAKSVPAMPRGSSKRANSARRSGGGGGGRRRSSTHRRVSHGGHGIKKPKLKPAPYPALKISDLPAMSIELPNSSRNRSDSRDKEIKGVVSVPTTPSTVPLPSAPGTTPGTPSSSGRKAGTTPSGQINLTPRTKVQFEVKGGNFVYRAKAKAGITPRRSPRKHAMSPLKAEYFREKKSHANMFCSSSNSSDKKTLFSPEAKNNFLGPSSSQEIDSSAAIPRY